MGDGGADNADTKQNRPEGLSLRGGGLRLAAHHCGSVTKPILRTPARWALAMAWATRS